MQGAGKTDHHLPQGDVLRIAGDPRRVDRERGGKPCLAIDVGTERQRDPDAADAATAGGFTVDRNQVVLDRPIKDLGLHAVTVVLHPEVSAKITMNVARSPEEAELQAAGKSIQELAAEAEAAADFEIAGMFDEMGAAQDGADLGRD